MDILDKTNKLLATSPYQIDERVSIDGCPGKITDITPLVLANMLLFHVRFDDRAMGGMTVTEHEIDE